jgi:hypothetical protein
MTVKKRQIKIVNMLTKHEDIIEVLNIWVSDLLILDRYLVKRPYTRYSTDIKKLTTTQRVTPGNEWERCWTCRRHLKKMGLSMRQMTSASLKFLKISGMYQLSTYTSMMTWVLCDHVIKYLKFLNMLI